MKKLKLKGAYWYPMSDREYEGWWSKDYSNMAAVKTAVICMQNDWRPEHVIRVLSDPFDFMLRYKTPGGAKVYIGQKEMLKTVRYYVSTRGEPMKKIAKPKGEIGQYKRKNGLKDAEFEKIFASTGPGVWDARIHTKNMSRYELVETNIENGRLVRECNRAENFNWSDVDFDYYTNEVRKLMIG